jgi:hypothetical protein
MKSSKKFPVPKNITSLKAPAPQKILGSEKKKQNFSS